MLNTYSLNINGEIVHSEKSIKLLGINTDNKLNFNKHIFPLQKRTKNQLSVICGLQRYKSFKEKEILINSFAYSNFNYYRLVWQFCSETSQRKNEKI